MSTGRQTVVSKTDFLTKAEILADFWVNYKDDARKGEVWEEFFASNDIALPLSYFISIEPPLAFLNDYSDGKRYIEETWEWYCGALRIDPDDEYGDMDETFDASPNEMIEP